MSRFWRRLPALLLAVLILAALPGAAWAAGFRYPDNQYFEEDSSLIKGITVQVAAFKDLEDAKQNQSRMLEAGYDCFLYFEGNSYRVMCGKFRSSAAAAGYRDSIRSNTDREQAYLTNVYLPEWAFREFEEIYRTDPLNSSTQAYTAGGKATGPYYDGDGAGERRSVYTVQLSRGSDLHEQEERRDGLIAAGFDAFVYKRGGGYACMSGLFGSEAEAQLRCDAIKNYAGESEAKVTTAELPQSQAKVQSIQNQAPYYTRYAELLRGSRWVLDYLPDERIETLLKAARAGEEDSWFYSVSDLDGNGVDELIVTAAVPPNGGAWAIFSCDSRGEVILMAWGYPYGAPVLSVCRERGTLAMQSYAKGLGLCDVYTFSEGSLRDAKRATVQDENFVAVDPAQADSRAQGYYVELCPYSLDDLSRLLGPETAAALPANSPVGIEADSPVIGEADSPVSFSREGVLAAARSAAAADPHYDTVSEKNVALQVPEDSQMLSEPFPMKVKARENGKVIFIIPRPSRDNGTLGTVAHGEVVTVLAETEYYFFFVTADGRAGWNGKSFFEEP